MPLHIDIRVNERLINQLHIGRVDELYSNTQTSEYLVVEGIMKPREVKYGDDGVSFTHKYDEGAEVCVMKAVAALRGSTEPDLTDYERDGRVSFINHARGTK